MKLLVTVVLAGVLAAPVLACGDPWMSVNLVATPGVKDALRAAFVAAHPGEQVRGPVSGRTYYGSYSGTRYALATFVVGSRTAYPTVFRTDRRGRWHVRHQTRGAVCSDVVPIDLLRTWWLEHQQGHCFVEPG